MPLMTRNKVKVLLALFVVGGTLHLVLDKGQTIYDNFDRISTYLDDDPLESVLANTVIHHDSDGNQSTLAYFTSEGVT